MGVIRRVAEVLQSAPTVEGAGVHVRRAFGFAEATRTDPFLQLDDLRSSSPADYLPGYPWHAHRGIETITYMLAGSLTYSDSLGNRGVTPAGEVMWMTAGSGVVHQEMPRGDRSGRLKGIQLWANLSAESKMRAPRYIEIVAEEIPIVDLPGGGRARVIAGHLEGVDGPVPDLMTTPCFFDLALPAGMAARLPATEGHTAILYVLSGDLIPGDGHALLTAGQAALYEAEGETLSLTAGEEGARAILIGGAPLREPMVHRGAIVMTTEREVEAALDELEEGTFIRDCASASAADEPD